MNILGGEQASMERFGWQEASTEIIRMGHKQQSIREKEVVRQTVQYAAIEATRGSSVTIPHYYKRSRCCLLHIVRGEQENVRRHNVGRRVCLCIIPCPLIFNAFIVNIRDRIWVPFFWLNLARSIESICRQGQFRQGQFRAHRVHTVSIHKHGCFASPSKHTFIRHYHRKIAIKNNRLIASSVWSATLS